MRAIAGIVLLLIGLEAKAQMIAPIPADSRPKVTPSASLEQPAMVQAAPAPVYVADPLFPAQVVKEAPSLIAEREPTRWRTDIVFGLPLALRAQRRLGDIGMWLEGGVSSYIDILGAFVGVRWDAHLYHGEENLLLVRPGLDLYYSPVSGSGGDFGHPYNGIVAGILDFDLNWQYRFSRRFHSSLGLKLGMGPVIVGGHVYPLPVFGLTLGCQF